MGKTGISAHDHPSNYCPQGAEGLFSELGLITLSNPIGVIKSFEYSICHCFECVVLLIEHGRGPWHVGGLLNVCQFDFCNEEGFLFECELARTRKKY